MKVSRSDSSLSPNSVTGSLHEKRDLSELETCLVVSMSLKCVRRSNVSL